MKIKFFSRNYDPGTGRFLSEDPIGFSGLDPNLYRYVKNNAVKVSDPSGNGPIAGGVCFAADIAYNGAMAMSTFSAKMEVASAYDQQIRNIQMQMNNMPKDCKDGTLRKAELNSQISDLNRLKAGALAEATNALTDALGASAAAGLACAGLIALPIP